MTFSKYTSLILLFSSSIVLGSCEDLLLERRFPIPPKSNQVDAIGAHLVADPYSRLENPKDRGTQGWLQGQENLMRSFMDGQKREADWIRTSLKKVNPQSESVLPEKEGIYLYKSKEARTASLYQVTKGSDGKLKSRVLVDPMNYGDEAQIVTFEISPDGKYFVFGINQGGADIGVYRVMNLNTLKIVGPDMVSKFTSIIWTPDSRGFYYTAPLKPAKARELIEKNKKFQLRYRFAETGGDDVILEQDPKAFEDFSLIPIENGNGMLIVVTDSAGGDMAKMYYKNIRDRRSSIVPIVDRYRTDLDVKREYNGKLLVFTHWKAPFGKLVLIDKNHPEKWEEVFKSTEEAAISLDANDEFIVGHFMKDGVGKVRIISRKDNSQWEVPIPKLSDVDSISLGEDNQLSIRFASFARPSRWVNYDLRKKELQDSDPDGRSLGYNLDDYERTVMYATSKDGTKVPVHLFHKKGLIHDGNIPVIMEGYGGFGVSISEAFWHGLPITWANLGGAFAWVTLRGGGEGGKEWRQAGALQRKQNVFDDFIAAGEHLIKEGVTKPKKLGIEGGSNGGLLMGAVVTQRPDLFGAVVPAFGVLDMYRFGDYTAGAAWMNFDYGNSAEEKDFWNLGSYSPLENSGTSVSYPPTMVLTGDHDDRVVPFHSYKFVAAMQEAQAGSAPIYMNVFRDIGHFSGISDRTIELDVYELVFFAKHLGVKIP